MARVFNGSSQYLRYASGLGGSEFTFSCWAYRSATGVSHVPISRSVSTGTVGTSLLTINTSNVLQLYAETASGQSANISGTTAITSGAWRHIAGVFSAGDYRIYVDGVLEASSTHANAPAAANEIAVSSRVYSGSRGDYFNGRIAYPCLHGAKLTADEIADLGRKLNGVPCGVHPVRIRPESLVACWPLGGFDGDHDGDIWANAYNLTAYNSPTWDESPAVLYSAGPLWLPAFTISSSDRTAAISGTMGAMSASLSAGFTKPTYTASIAGTQAPMTAALGATRTLPTFAASIAASHAAMSASLAASFTKPAYSATIGATHAPMAASLGAAFGDPEFIASIAASHAPMSAAVSATFDEPTYTASIAGTLGAMTSTVSATSATEIDTASIVATMGAMTASLTAVYSDIVYVTTDCGIVPHFTRSTVPRFRRRNIVASIRRNTVPRFRRARR